MREPPRTLASDLGYILLLCLDSLTLSTNGYVRISMIKNALTFVKIKNSSFTQEYSSSVAPIVSINPNISPSFTCKTNENSVFINQTDSYTQNRTFTCAVIYRSACPRSAIGY